MSEQKLREALEHAIAELEFAVAIIGRHYEKRDESISVFLSEVRKLLSQPTSDEGTPLREAISAAKNMDWQQVVLNGGPPCFHLEEGRFCGRAARWAGHDEAHKFVSLADLMLAALPSGYVQVPRDTEELCDVCGDVLGDAYCVPCVSFVREKAFTLGYSCGVSDGDKGKCDVKPALEAYWVDVQNYPNLHQRSATPTPSDPGTEQVNK